MNNNKSWIIGIITILFCAIILGLYNNHVVKPSNKETIKVVENLQEIEFAFEEYENMESDSVSMAAFIQEKGIDIIYVVVHTSAESDKGQFKDGDHINRFFFDDIPYGRGWNNPGYHIWISRNCITYFLKDFNLDCIIEPWEVANGARGYNSVSFHISYSSAIPKDNPTEDTMLQCQEEKIAEFIKLFQHACKKVEVIGHRDLPGVTKSCPNFDTKEKFKYILK